MQLQAQSQSSGSAFLAEQDRPQKKPSQGSPERFLRLSCVMSQTALGKTSIYDMIQKKTFPKPVRLGLGKRGSIRFVESEVQQWINVHCEARG